MVRRKSIGGINTLYIAKGARRKSLSLDTTAYDLPLLLYPVQRKPTSPQSLRAAFALSPSCLIAFHHSTSNRSPQIVQYCMDDAGLPLANAAPHDKAPVQLERNKLVVSGSSD